MRYSKLDTREVSAIRNGARVVNNCLGTHNDSERKRGEVSTVNGSLLGTSKGGPITWISVKVNYVSETKTKHRRTVQRYINWYIVIVNTNVRNNKSFPFLETLYMYRSQRKKKEKIWFKTQTLIYSHENQMNDFKIFNQKSWQGLCVRKLTTYKTLYILDNFKFVIWDRG